MKTSRLEIRESSGLPGTQARAVLKVLEQEMTSSQEAPATKTVLERLRLVTQKDFADLRRR